MVIYPNDVPKSHKKINHYPIKAWGLLFGHRLGYNGNYPSMIGATSEMFMESVNFLGMAIMISSLSLLISKVIGKSSYSSL
jgi:hypothetical protein